MDLTPVQLGPSFVCVLRSGGDYVREHVEILKAQFDRQADRRLSFRCLTDTPEKPYDVPMETQWPGWWSLLEAFRFVGPTVLVGLDTLITGSLSPLIERALHGEENTLLGCRDFYSPRRWSSAVTVWNGDWRCLPALFDPVADMRRFRGDQNFTEDAVLRRLPLLGLPVELGFLQDETPGIASYKRDFRDVSPRPESPGADTMLVCFHGRPRPWEVTEGWVPVHVAAAKV